MSLNLSVFKDKASLIVIVVASVTIASLVMSLAPVVKVILSTVFVGFLAFVCVKAYRAVNVS